MVLTENTENLCEGVKDCKNVQRKKFWIDEMLLYKFVVIYMIFLCDDDNIDDTRNTPVFTKIRNVS